MMIYTTRDSQAAVVGVVEELCFLLANIVSRATARELTFCVPKLKGREVIAQDLWICVVAFAITAAATQLATSPRTTIAFFSIPTGGMVVFILLLAI
jgi:hypothetical protein